MAPQKLPIVLIGGPTASGKSAVALALAQKFEDEDRRAVILNADALQLYRDLRVLTARPDEKDERLVPHRLYGIWDGGRRGSVADWLELVREEIATALDAGWQPIVVGGSGMYLHALLNGLAQIPEIDPDMRAASVARHAALGGAAFRAELATLDPVSAAKLHESDTQRLIRAYEVVKSTGRTLPDWQSAPTDLPPPHWQFGCFVIEPARTTLYANCDMRFDKMLQNGARDEVQKLLERNLPPDMPVMKAVGVPELAAVLKNELPLENARLKAQQSTRNYAKRQLTWFRHQLASAMRLEHDKPHIAQENNRIAGEIHRIVCNRR